MVFNYLEESNITTISIMIIEDEKLEAEPIIIGSSPKALPTLPNVDLRSPPRACKIPCESFKSVLEWKIHVSLFFTFTITVESQSSIFSVQ